MDLGFFSDLLNGKGKGNGLSALLPLLLGGKNQFDGKGDIGSVLSSLFKGSSRDNDGSFPPLFGEQKNGNSAVQNGVLDLLGNMIKPPVKSESYQEKKPEYPYELQYNRPMQTKKSF